MSRGRSGIRRRAAVLVVMTLALTPAWSQSFDWHAEVSIESSVSVGDLSDAAEVAPDTLGGDAILGADDLQTAGDAGYEVQTVFRNLLRGAALAAWTSPGVGLELALSAMVLQSPSGYGGDGFAFAPGPGGVRILRSPSSWSGGRLMVWLGRELFVDPTGRVVRQIADGAGFAIRYPRLYVSLGAGSTALVDKYLYDTRLLDEDRAVFSDETAVLAPSRLIALMSVEYGGVRNNDLGVFAAYYDARAPGAQDDAWYVGVVAEGVVVEPVTHRSSVVAQGRGSNGAAALLAATDMAIAFERPRLRLTLGGLYGSSDGATLSRFEAISSAAAGRVVAVPYGDLVRISLGAAPGPFAAGRLSPSVRGDLFLSSDPDATGGAWLGAELIGAIAFRLLDDLVITAEGGAAHSALGWTPYGRMQGRLRL